MANGLRQQDMPAGVEDLLGDKLAADEQILWAGRPRQGIVLSGQDAFLLPFSLVWCGFVVFWFVLASAAARESLFFLAFGVFFLLIGAYFVIGRLIVDAFRRAKTFYAVTNQRVIIISGLLVRKESSLDIRKLSALSLSQRPDGTGTITLAAGHPTAQALIWLSSLLGAGPLEPRLEGIADAKEIYGIIRGAREHQS